MNNQSLLATSAGWFLGRVSRLLEPEDREAVLGDLMEAGESAGHALLGVLGLVARRQIPIWNNWRPWLAAFGLALPFSFVLMGFSLSVSQSYQQFIGSTILRATGLTVGPGLSLLFCNSALLLVWAWTAGFAISSISRKTLWVSASLSFAPCVFCLERFHLVSISRLSLLLFLPPAIWGVSKGLQLARMKLSTAILLALSLTALTIPTWRSKGAWIPNWALSWPAWYLVATAQRSKPLPLEQSHAK